MSWQERRRPKKRHPWPPPEPMVLVSLNEQLKRLDREGKLDAYMAAWVERERERE